MASFSDFNMYTIGAILVSCVAVLISSYASYWKRSAIPRIGKKPGVLGNTSSGHFSSHSLELIKEGWSLYKDSVYSLWTTDMDRVIVSPKFMKDFQALPRKDLKLTASVRHAGPWTGFDIAEESELQFIVCASQLSQNIGRLAQPVHDEISWALNRKLEEHDSHGAPFEFSPFLLAMDLVSSATARVFVGPDLCRDPAWLATATGYTLDVQKVGADLKRFYRILHPVVAPFLSSYHQIRQRFRTAKRLLEPLIIMRDSGTSKEYPDMVQWLVESAKGRDAEIDKLVTRMLFLNAAAIFTTAETAANILLDLCTRPDDMAMIEEEMRAAVKEHEGITLATLSSLKKTDSFMKESHRLETLGLFTFNRQLGAPVTLSNGVTLHKDAYISMNHYLINRDPVLYPHPDTFDPLRFYKLRQNKGQEDQHQFASLSSQNPSWGVGKASCPGRFWASAQIKLVLMVLLLQFDMTFGGGQTERLPNLVKGEKNTIDMTQKVLLKRRN